MHQLLHLSLMFGLTQSIELSVYLPFRKLPGIRSRLYGNRCLQTYSLELGSRWKALDGIYQINIPLPLPNHDNSVQQISSRMLDTISQYFKKKR